MARTKSANGNGKARAGGKITQKSVPIHKRPKNGMVAKLLIFGKAKIQCAPQNKNWVRTGRLP